MFTFKTTSGLYVASETLAREPKRFAFRELLHGSKVDREWVSTIADGSLVFGSVTNVVLNFASGSLNGIPVVISLGLALVFALSKLR